MKVLVVGGNRFFGRRLVEKLVAAKHEVTLLNRQTRDDGFDTQVKRIKLDRKELFKLADQSWDLVYDQVCYDAEAAQQACEIFSGKVGKYIFTSTVSVYLMGEDIQESQFDPSTYIFSKVVMQNEDYGEAKRQAEAVFAKNMKAPLTMVRFPFVLGPDDYTGRLKWHVEKIKNSKPIYFPAIQSKVSFIHAADAARFLYFLSDHDLQGPVNCAASKPLALTYLVGLIESITGNKSLLTHSPEQDEHHSPYGVKNDWFVNVTRLKNFGFEAEEIMKWLPDLVKSELKQLTPPL